MIRYLYFGDVFGRPGREAVEVAVDRFRKSHNPDVMIANVENAAHGKGVTPRMVEEFLSWGFDVLTTGNHAWDQGEIIDTFRNEPRLLRPLNYGDKSGMYTPGSGVVVIEPKSKPGLKVAVLLAMGRVFMDPLDCPFHCTNAEVEELLGQGINNIFIDFHGEASSEKQAFTYFFEGRATAVVGSHQHVQTADERILPGGTAAITDVGMCGVWDSVIGVKKENSIRRFLSKMPQRFEPAEGPAGYGAIVIDADETTGRAIKIERFRNWV
jgi:2',3'-cyclic-nucleotide 2'-phosphodiesterase